MITKNIESLGLYFSQRRVSQVVYFVLETVIVELVECHMVQNYDANPQKALIYLGQNGKWTWCSNSN